VLHTSCNPTQGASLNGIDFGSGAESANAQSDLSAVFAGLVRRAQTYGSPIPAALGSTTRYPGVYTSPTYMVLDAQLNLDAQGDSNAVWVFVR